MLAQNAETVLSLYEFGDILQLNPWELAQFGEGFPQPNNAQCQSVFFQRSWPYDYLSREEIAATIEKAEAAIAGELGFWPGPKYLEETVPFPSVRPGGVSDYPYGVFGVPAVNGWPGQPTLKLNTGRILGGGVRAYTAIGDAAVVYHDYDGDGVNEAFSLTIATTVTDPNEIGVYNTAVDRLGEDLSEGWRIRPVKVTIAGGNVNITGPAALLGLPLKYMVTNPESLDVTLPGNFVTQVSIVRVYRDATATQDSPQQGWALWDAWSGDCSDQPCQETATPICVAERLALGGIVAANYSDPSRCLGWRNPNRVYVRYLAGRDLVNGKMERQMADLVAHLAAAWLPFDKCGCERSARILHWWRSLPTDADIDGEGTRAITTKEIDTPFGERRGAIYAWQRVKRLRISGATAL